MQVKQADRLPTPPQDFNQLTGSLPAPATNSPMVYLTAAFQARLLCLGRCSVPHVFLMLECADFSPSLRHTSLICSSNMAGVCFAA